MSVELIPLANNRKYVELEENKFFDKFKPMKNEIGTHEGFGGYMFETSGEEMEYVRKIYSENPDRVWTLHDNFIIGNGLHYVNRLGYLITEIPCESDTDYEIRDPDFDENGDLIE